MPDNKEIFTVSIDPSDEKCLGKSAKRHFRANNRETIDLRSRENPVSKENLEQYRKRFSSNTEKPLKPIIRIERKPKKFRMLEIFTWTYMITKVAAERESVWECFEAITLPDFDITTVQGREKARK